MEKHEVDVGRGKQLAPAVPAHGHHGAPRPRPIQRVAGDDHPPIQRAEHRVHKRGQRRHRLASAPMPRVLQADGLAARRDQLAEPGRIATRGSQRLTLGGR